MILQLGRAEPTLKGKEQPNTGEESSWLPHGFRCWLAGVAAPLKDLMSSESSTSMGSF